MTAIEVISEKMAADPVFKDGFGALLKIAEKPEVKPMAFYTYEEIAYLLSVHYDTIRRAVRSGHLVPEYVGSEPRFRGREILRWLREGGKTGRSRRNLEEEAERKGR
jgi:excisionase family DNA binding protein